METAVAEIDVEPVELDSLISTVRLGSAAEPFGPLLVVDGPHDADQAGELVGIPAVIVGRGSGAAPAWCDVVVADDDELADVAATVAAAPIAAVTFAMLLRGADDRSLDDALTVESATYSTLQAGPEFARWLSARRPATPRPAASAVLVERDATVLRLTLQRPEVRNALNAQMRDELLDALRLIALDDTITAVELRGAGPSFCAGGDLDEFGTFANPSAAHLVRLEHHVGRAIARCGVPFISWLHGHAVGSGIEIPAFGTRLVATPDTLIALPEVRLGLVPGAGGTASLPTRIGRHRTAWLGLTARRIDAATALEWGLLDEVSSS